MAEEYPTEQAPLEPDPSQQTYQLSSEESPKSGYTLSKFTLIVIVLVIVFLIILVIVLAAVLGAERAKSDSKGERSVNPTTTTATTTGPPRVWDNVRLPSAMAPQHYDLNMRIDPNKDSFSGDVEILVNVTSNTPYVILHSRDLNITQVQLVAAKKIIPVKNAFLYTKNQYHVTVLESPMEPGSYTLKYEFGGWFAKGLFGLYKGTNKLISGKMEGFAATLLEPVEARSVFPCFDEPAFKATFTVSIAHPKDMQAYTNMGVKKSDVKGDTRISYYNKSVRMSTYLVAFTVGHFEFIGGSTARGTKLRVLAQPGRKDQMQYSLKIANETLSELETFFGIVYPLPKLDLIAPPECFIAMENWGLINFEEDGLLYKEGFSNEEVQQNLLVRWLPHEIVHMWFGNLVTLQWWNEIWLNEAFADYYTYHQAVPVTNKDWKEEVQFIHTNLAYALELDGYKNTRSVVEHTILPNIGTLDNIVYKKGSSIIKMLINHIGSDAFTRGIKRYLDTHKFGNAVTDDVWRALQQECPISASNCINIKAFGDPWVKNLGYPVVTIASDGKVIAEHFLYDKNEKKSQANWDIPFTYRTAGANKNFWIKPSGAASVDWDGKVWIKGNVDQIGVYRVNYPDSNWDVLATSLSSNSKTLSEMDRYGMLDDAFNLARGGRLHISKAMTLTRYLRAETAYVVWEGVKTNLNYIKRILDPSSSVYRYLQNYLAFQSKTMYDKLGFRNDGKHLDKLNRLTAVQFQCDQGAGGNTTQCLDKLSAMFVDWKNDHMSTSVIPVLRKLVYYYGVARGTKEDWDLVYKRVHTSIIASEMQPLLYGLAGSRDPWTLDNLLNMMIDPTKIKKQYAKYVLDYVANENPVGVNVAWSFVRSNWDKLKKKSGSAMSAMLTYIPTVTKRFSTPYQLQQLTAFINDNLEGQQMPRHIGKALEVVKTNIQWRADHEKNLENWLKNFS